MSDTRPPVDLTEARAAVKAAYDELSALCHSKQFRVSIPMRDTDSDIVIGIGLHFIEDLIDEVERLRPAPTTPAQSERLAS
jgi:hypothetical protein